MIRLTGHSNAVVGLAFAPDGRLASASRDGTVRLWEMPAGRELGRISSPCQFASAVDVSQDGRFLAAGFSEPHAFAYWWKTDDLDKPMSSARLDDDRDTANRWCFAVRFTPGGNHLVALTAERAWSFLTRNGDVVGKLTTRCIYVDCDIDKDGSVILINRNCDAEAWTSDFVNAKHLFHAPVGINQLRCCSNRICLFNLSSLYIWDGPPARTPRHWVAHEQPIISLAVAPTGDCAFTGAHDGLVKRWDIVNGRALDTWDFGIGEVFSLAVSRDELTAAAGGLTDIVVWDLLS